jgi:hypothetical protein
MVAGLAGIAGHGVTVDSHEPLGLADPAALGDMLQDCRGLLLGQVGMEQWSSLAFGESVAAGPTTKEANRAILAIVFADGEVFSAPEAMVGAPEIQAAEPREVIHGPPPATYPINRSKGCNFLPG